MANHQNGKGSQIRRITVVLGITVSVLVFVSYALNWAMNEPPVSSQAMAKIHHGMLTNEVKRILGSPTRVSISGNKEEWIYSHPLKWQYVTVNFRDDRVVQMELDR